LDGLVIGEQACVLCGGPMVQRTNKATGDAFWGCSGFPHCRGMRPLGDMGERSVPTGLMTVATEATKAGVQQKCAGENEDGDIPF
jgi:ssDNA-binding Zn-finger/Zn-ribbon topoisomerase 1